MRCPCSQEGPASHAADAIVTHVPDVLGTRLAPTDLRALAAELEDAGVMPWMIYHCRCFVLIVMEAFIAWKARILYHLVKW